MKVFGMCIDKRAVVAVVAVAGLLWWLAPGAVAAALPLLLFAICPLSMLFMMKAMNGMNGNGNGVDGGGADAGARTPVAPRGVPAAAAEPAGETPLDAVTAAAADVESRRN
jgi:hypothetical protein